MEYKVWYEYSCYDTVALEDQTYWKEICLNIKLNNVQKQCSVKKVFTKIQKFLNGNSSTIY